MEETIQLRQIINILIKGKKIIWLFTIIFIFAAGIISWGFLDEKYQSKAVVQVSSGVQDEGIMSNYVGTEFTPIVYMQRMQNVEQNKKYFKENGIIDYNKRDLKVTNPLNTNLIEMEYISSSPENAQKHLKLLMEKTKTEARNSIKETFKQLAQTYNKETTSISEEIEQLMSEYNNLVIDNQLPEVLILQTVSSSQFVLNLTNDQTQALGKISGELQNNLLQLKAQIDTKSNEYRNVLSKYQTVKTGLDSFSVDPFIRIIIEPTLAEEPYSPKKLLNILIGLVLGLMIGTMVVLFRSYWLEPENK